MNDNKDIMNLYFQFVCTKAHIIDVLECFSNGIGVQLCSIITVFSDDPDVIIYHDWPELKNFNGVGFFSDYESTLLVSYQEFYENLKDAVEKFTDKNKEYAQSAEEYLKKFEERYIPK